jgi:transcriptional regulator of acetoin/glycerol metabolism
MRENRRFAGERQGRLHSDHVNRVIATVEGSQRLVGELPSAEIAASWRRCLEEYGLAPNRVDQVQVLTAEELKEFRDPVEDVVSIAQPEIDRLFRHVGDDYIVVFTDTQGVAVDFRVSDRLEADARRTGIYLGSIWNERSQGTNGVGTCLRISRPVSVVQDEHFALRNTTLTCTAVPVRDPQGRIVAVLDTGTPRASDHARERLLLGIMVGSVRRIESRLFQRTYRDALIVRLSSDPDFLDTAEECLIALDSAGRLIAADHCAPELLGYEEVPSLLGRRVDSVLCLGETALLSTIDGAPAPLTGLGGQARRLYARAVAPRRERRSNGHKARPPRAELDLEALAGGDAQMAHAVHIARRLIDNGLPILLLGETGCGKSAFAEALHRASRRAGGPFIPVNCAAIPETLIEGELFGYRPGAFTGAAREGARGKLLEANGGTLLLDVIGDMPLAVQTRLLRVLSEGEVTPLGAARPVPVDIAVIAATHQPIDRLVAEQRFREDLYHRLAGATLRLPALRERSDRGALIARVFAAEAALQGRSVALAPETAAFLERYSWPGNVRELRYVARYAVSLCDDGTVTLACLPERLLGALDTASPSGAAIHAQVLQLTLERCKWNVSMAARLLGVSRSTLHRQIRECNLRRPSA